MTEVTDNGREHDIPMKGKVPLVNGMAILVHTENDYTQILEFMCLAEEAIHFVDYMKSDKVDGTELREMHNYLHENFTLEKFDEVYKLLIDTVKVRDD